MELLISHFSPSTQRNPLAFGHRASGSISLRVRLGCDSALFWDLSVGVWGLPLIWLLLSQPVSAQTTREFQVKAVFLFNFARFTQWPPDAFPKTNSPVVIGVLGTDPFGSFLPDTVRDERVNGRLLAVERYQTLEEIETCHILYIGQSEAGRLDEILTALKGKPILTVTDIEGAATRGAVVRFVNERNRVRFRVNLETAHALRLNLSSKLLRAAEIVGLDNK